MKVCQKKQKKTAKIADYLSSTINFSTVEQIKVKPRLKIKAVSQPLATPPMLKPASNESANFTIAALITKVNNPKVRQEIGNEKKLILGLRNVFNKESTMATFTASSGSFTVTWSPNIGNK